MDEEAQLPMKAKPSEDALTIRDMVSQAKDTELKSHRRRLKYRVSLTAFYVYMSHFLFL